MTEVLKGFLENLGYRFFLSSLAPAFVLAAGSVSVIALYPDPAIAAEMQWWGRFLAALAGSTPFWILVTLLALTSIALNRFLIQVWEGYPRLWLWDPLWIRWRRWRGQPLPKSPLETWQEEAQAAAGPLRLALIRAQEAGTEDDLEALRRAVARKWLDAGLEAPLDLRLPTRLGRLLRRMEAQPFLRYGIDATTLWSRLLLVVPAAVADQYRSGKTWLDFGLNFASVAAFLAAGGGVLAWRLEMAAAWILPVALLVLSHLFYRSALPAARTMSLAFETAFDLYRAPLLELWGLEPPATVAEERPLWLQLGHFRRFSDPHLFPEERRKRPETSKLEAGTAPRRIPRRRKRGG